MPKKIELIQERILIFHFNDHKNSYDEILKKCNYTTMLIKRIKAIPMDVFKSLHDLNPK